MQKCDNIEFIKVTDETSIDIVEQLAKEIWGEHYPAIIGDKQVDYMLKKYQSKKAISKQIKKGFEYYLIKHNNKNLGYFSIFPEKKKNELFLSKIYLKLDKRKKGYGKKIIGYIINIAKQIELNKISLTVNKNNITAIKAYKKLGFKNVGSTIKNIGNGFVMDDYKMEMNLSASI